MCIDEFQGYLGDCLIKLIRVNDQKEIVKVIVKRYYESAEPLCSFIKNFAIIGRQANYDITIVNLVTEQVYDYSFRYEWSKIIPNPSNTLWCVLEISSSSQNPSIATFTNFYDLAQLGNKSFVLDGIDRFFENKVGYIDNGYEIYWSNLRHLFNEFIWLDDDTIKIIEMAYQCKNCNQWECCNCRSTDGEDLDFKKSVCEIIFQKRANQMELIDFTIIEPEGSKWKQFLE